MPSHRQGESFSYRFARSSHSYAQAQPRARLGTEGHILLLLRMRRDARAVTPAPCILAETIESKRAAQVGVT